MVEFLQILELVIELAPEALVVLGLVAAYLILIYAIITFVEESGKLRTQFYQVDSHLQAIRAQFPQRRRQIAAIKKAIVPLRKDFRQFCDYYAELRDIQIEAERQVMRGNEPERDIGVRDNLDLLPVRSQWSLSNSPPIEIINPARFN